MALFCRQMSLIIQKMKHQTHFNKDAPAAWYSYTYKFFDNNHPQRSFNICTIDSNIREVLRTFSCTFIHRSLTPSSFRSKQVMQRQVLNCPLLPASSRRSATALPGVQKGSIWVFDNWKSVSAQFSQRRRSSSVPSFVVWFLFAQITTLAPLWPSLLTTFHDSNGTLYPRPQQCTVLACTGHFCGFFPAE